MTQVVIMLYEDPTKDISSDERFHVELHFSPGVNCCVQKELPPGPGFRPHSRSKGSHSYADFDLEPALATPPPPLVCTIKCSKDSFANVFEKPSDCCGEEFTFDDVHEAMEIDDEDCKSSINTAVSEPIEIKVTSTNLDDESSKPESCPEADSSMSQDRRSESFGYRRRSKSMERNDSVRRRSLDNEANDESSLTVEKDAFFRAHRHSIPGHRLTNYLKFLHELAAQGSTFAHLFSTAVISGSSSAPNLQKEMPPRGENVVLSVGMPSIRPLETLHNSLSLRQLDAFLEYVTATIFKTPCPSPRLRSPLRSLFGASSTKTPSLSQSSRQSSFGMWSVPPYCETKDLMNRIRKIHFKRHNSNIEDEEFDNYMTI